MRKFTVVLCICAAILLPVYYCYAIANTTSTLSKQATLSSEAAIAATPPQIVLPPAYMVSEEQTPTAHRIL